MTSTVTIDTPADITIDTPAEAMPLSYDQAIVASYGSHYDAEKAVRLLREDGLPMERISIIGRHLEMHEEMQGFYRPSDAALAGAEAGAWFGGLAGLLIGTGLFIVPALGPVFILGPLAGLVAGAAFGAAAGALIGGLVFLGVPEDQAVQYQERIHAGEYIVVVHGATAEETDRACRILKDSSQTYFQAHHIFHGGAL